MSLTRSARPRGSAPGRAVLVLLLLTPPLLLVACGGDIHDHGVRFPGGSEAPDAGQVGDMKFQVPPPPFQGEDIFPCTECHEDAEDDDPERRDLTVAHEDIVLRHDETNRWCLDCHDFENRDMLRLANGTLVPFTESYRLCGQCHGSQFRDWRAGVHGRRVGHWNGEKEYLLCVYCHDSHRPRFQPRPPEPPPLRPEKIR